MEVKPCAVGRNAMQTTILNNQKGAVAVLFWIMLVVIIAFAGLAVDVGAWFVARAELSKSVDAGALAGAKNISNPFAPAVDVAKEFARENFREGSAWTIGAPTFNASKLDNTRISVGGSVNTESYFARVFGVNVVLVNNSAIAKKNAVEIMLVLDRSGSMEGDPMDDLKDASLSFISFFEDTQAEDRLGLISFAKGVTVDVSLRNNFVSAMTNAIDDMEAGGYTNAEDAIDRADGPSGFTDFSGLPGDQWRQQYLIFFSDGNPNTFRGRFKYKGVDYDAVVNGTGNFCDEVDTRLANPDTGNNLSNPSIDPRLTGDGNTFAASACRQYPELLTTRWYVFEDYPLAGHGTQDCFIAVETGQDIQYDDEDDEWYVRNSAHIQTPLSGYVCTTAKQMAVDHAQELKDRGVIIYAVGFIGSGGVNEEYLADIASGPDLVYVTPDSGELQTIFNKIAKDIKLRLVQ